MACSACAANKFVVLALAGSMFVVAGCDNDSITKSPRVGFGIASPLAAAPLVTTSIVPQRLGLTPLFGIRCATFPSLTTRFDLVVTVPASFDDVARNLTVEAARKAGLENITLLEEPQAAFYCWLGTHSQTEAGAQARVARKRNTGTAAA